MFSHIEEMWDVKRKRKAVYVSVEDALKNDAFPDFLEVQKRSQKVTTNRSLVTVYAHETEICQKLAEVQRDGNNHTVFRNILGDRFCFTRPHIRKDIEINGYFRRCPSEAENHVSPAVSDAHEKAVLYAEALVSRDQLRVVKLCGHSSHKQVNLAEQWVPERWMHACVEAIQVNCGDTRTTKISYRWKTPDDQIFVIDLVRAALPCVCLGDWRSCAQAVLEDGELHTAIEIQKSHANSISKRNAFAKHDIVDVQIEVCTLPPQAQ